MLLSPLLATAALLPAVLSSVVPARRTRELPQKRWDQPIAPKVMIISMFDYEEVWFDALKLYEPVGFAGASPLYPNVACTSSGDICTMTTGEGEINAATSVMAILLDNDFDLRKTYFLIAGIAGINPYEGTIASVGLARYAVQVALAYELDAREIPSNWTTGYWLLGADQPGQPAVNIYGTEVFELNTNLRKLAMGYAKGVTLNDTAEAQTLRAMYDYAPANEPPKVFYGDVATSDVYFTGPLLGEAFGNITKIWTNGTGNYALTAQEDNASLEALVRATKAGRADVSRVILMRTASDFDRSPAGQNYTVALDGGGGFLPSLANILIAGMPIVEGIVNDWDSTFAGGVTPQASWLYNSDDLHTLSQRKRALRPGMRRRW